jgi:hypothetical protein
MGSHLLLHVIDLTAKLQAPVGSPDKRVRSWLGGLVIKRAEQLASARRFTNWLALTLNADNDNSHRKQRSIAS